MNSAYEKIELRQAAILEGIEQQINVLFGKVVVDVNFLTQMADSGTIQDVALTLSQSAEIYDQIRILNSEGMETLRVNHDGFEARIVGEELLQDKGNRYYFIDTMNLPLGTLYFSPLDLNVKQDELQVPHKPMIRIAKTYIGDDETKQLVIINYIASELIDLIATSERSFSYGRLMFINHDVYNFYGNPTGRDWAFMFSDVEDSESFQSQFGELQDVWLDRFCRCRYAATRAFFFWSSSSLFCHKPECLRDHRGKKRHDTLAARRKDPSGPGGPPPGQKTICCSSTATSILSG